jgi:hypothetical protein
MNEAISRSHDTHSGDPKREILVEKYFDRTETQKEADGFSYTLIEFKPKSSEIEDIIKKLQFYLFGGNGNISAQERRDYPNLYDEELLRIWEMDKRIRTNLEEATTKSAEAIELIDKLLKSVAGFSLLDCFSHTFYGEQMALRARTSIEQHDTDVEKRVVQLLQNKDRGRWMLSQLSPYTPYFGTVFTRNQTISEACKDSSPKAELKMVPVTKNTEFNAQLKNAPPGMEWWRLMHREIYSQKAEMLVACILNQDWENREVQLSENYSADAIRKAKGQPIYSGQALDGWTIPPLGETIADSADAVLVTGKEFFEHGVIKFIVPNQRKRK